MTQNALPELRERISNAVEGLVALLDAIDGEADMEDNGDFEPSLSAGTFNWTLTSQRAEFVDCELDYAELGEPEDGT